MARKKSDHEKSSEVINALYVLAVGVLILAMVLMYGKHLDKKTEYNHLVREAKMTDSRIDLTARTRLEEELDDAEEKTPAAPEN